MSQRAVTCVANAKQAVFTGLEQFTLQQLYNLRARLKSGYKSFLWTGGFLERDASGNVCKLCPMMATIPLGGETEIPKSFSRVEDAQNLLGIKDVAPETKMDGYHFGFVDGLRELGKQGQWTAASHLYEVVNAVIDKKLAA
jgi:hypothetical protein